MFETFFLLCRSTEIFIRSSEIRKFYILRAQILYLYKDRNKLAVFLRDSFGKNFVVHLRLLLQFLTKILTKSAFYSIAFYSIEFLNNNNCVVSAICRRSMKEIFFYLDQAWI